ncbi:hypothetical protein T05_13728 [Trichinella murrelli]|uniref:Uncharacterized protein n=1 Tax=Trichinella murrelli TaxID=144512 RepID=A0A0V0T394_9BILA|nr:hypothetical protein T05_13728 [Trichinella murrelli]
MIIMDGERRSTLQTVYIKELKCMPLCSCDLNLSEMMLSFLKGSDRCHYAAAVRYYISHSDELSLLTSGYPKRRLRNLCIV